MSWLWAFYLLLRYSSKDPISSVEIFWRDPCLNTEHTRFWSVLVKKEAVAQWEGKSERPLGLIWALYSASKITVITESLRQCHLMSLQMLIKAILWFYYQASRLKIDHLWLCIVPKPEFEQMGRQLIDIWLLLAARCRFHAKRLSPCLMDMGSSSCFKWWSKQSCHLSMLVAFIRNLCRVGMKTTCDVEIRIGGRMRDFAVKPRLFVGACRAIHASRPHCISHSYLNQSLGKHPLI